MGGKRSSALGLIIGGAVGLIIGLVVAVGLAWLVLLPSSADLERTALALVPDGFGSVTTWRQEWDIILGQSEMAMASAVRPGSFSASDVDLAEVVGDAGMAVLEEDEASNGRLVTASTRGAVAYLTVRGDVIDGQSVSAFSVAVRREYGTAVLWPIPVLGAAGATVGALAARERGGRRTGSRHAPATPPGANDTGPTG